MPFPLTIAGEVALPHASDEEVAAVCDQLVEVLEKQGASTTLYYLPEISFRVPLWRGFRWNWEFLAPLDRIDLKVVKGADGPRLQYRLSLVRLVAVMTFSVVAMSFAMRDVADKFPGWIWFAMWGWVVASSYVITKLRAPRFFRRAMAQIAPAGVYS